MNLAIRFLAIALSLISTAQAANHIHASLPTVLSAYVCTHLLTGKATASDKPIEGPVQPVKIIAISSYEDDPGAVPTFTILSEEGGTFYNLPPHGFVFNAQAIRKTLVETVFRNSPSPHFTIQEDKTLKKISAWVRTRSANGEMQSPTEVPTRGKYLFTIDWHGDNQLLYAIQSDAGNLLLYPPFKVLFSKQQPNPSDWPDWKPQLSEWRLPNHTRRVNLNDLSNLAIPDEQYRYTAPDTFPRETVVVPLSQETLRSPALKRRIWARIMPNDKFIEMHGSGTLRKNARYMRWADHADHERIAFEFGYAFESVPSTRVELGNAISEGDTKALTEFGWHMERIAHLSPFPEDVFQAAHIRVSEPNGQMRSGIAIVVKETSLPHVRKGHLVFAIVSEWDEKTNQYKPAVNPF